MWGSIAWMLTMAPSQFNNLNCFFKEDSFCISKAYFKNRFLSPVCFIRRNSDKSSFDGLAYMSLLHILLRLAYKIILQFVVRNLSNVLYNQKKLQMQYTNTKLCKVITASSLLFYPQNSRRWPRLKIYTLLIWPSVTFNIVCQIRN